jgi:hypothetical protein
MRCGRRLSRPVRSSRHSSAAPIVNQVISEMGVAANGRSTAKVQPLPSVVRT